MTRPRHFRRIRTSLIVFLLATRTVNAGDWEIEPRLTVAESFSDNVNLDESNEDSDFITEVIPGISVHGRGGRVVADLDYEMQNVFFLDNSDENTIFHQLEADATAEMSKNFFFVDAASALGQATIDSEGSLSTGNLNTAGNRTDFVTYSISPYITPHFGGYADGVFRYRYGQVKYDEGASDAEENSFDARLVSGRNFVPLSWNANYTIEDLNRDDATDEEFENGDLNARYRLNDEFSLVAQGGYADNDFNTIETIENGSYWAVGGFWQPSRYYSLQALAGNNLETATVGLYPIRRTALSVTYRDRDVGLNNGPVWTGSLTHRTRRTTWSADYVEDTTTEQQSRLQNSLVFLDPSGNLIIIPEFISLTDEVIERKRGTGTFQMDTGRSKVRVSVFDERRRFLTSLTDDRSRGVSGSWDRRLAPRTNTILTGSYQLLADRDVASDLEDVFLFIQAELVHRLGNRIDGTLLYRFTRRDSNDNARDYDENSIAARLTAYF